MAAHPRRGMWTVGLIAAVVLASLTALAMGPLAPSLRTTPATGVVPGPANPPNTTNPSNPSVPGSGPGTIGGTTSTAVTVLSGWEGIQYGSNHGVLDYVDPPDVPLAVGPNYVFELSNGLGMLWTRSGSFVQIVNPQSLFQVASTDGIGDARVVYDALSGRWFASAADFTTGNVVLAVSTTSDPAGSWRAFTFPTGEGCPDQPWMGLSSDKVVLSLNTFSACDSTFTGGMFWAINKTDLVTGATPRFTSWGPNLNFLNMVPVQAMTATTTAYMAWPIQPNYVRVFTLTGVPPATVTLAYHDYTVSALTNPPNAIQPGTNYTLRTGDNRLRDGFWSAGRLWITYNDGCVPSGDTATRACVRLTQLDTTNQTVLQDFDVGLANTYLFYPALRTDGRGNLIVVFGVSSATLYPSVDVAARAPTDAVNTLGPWATVRTGAGSRTPTYGSCTAGVCRYGDYFGVAVDPSNSSRLWTAGEYGNTTGWGTHIDQVCVSSSPPAATPPSVTTRAATAVNQTGASLQGNLTALGTATSVSVGFRYGTSASLTGATNVSVGTRTAPGPFSQVLSGLAASTTNYFQAWASGQGFSSGTILSFTTSAPPPAPPGVSTSAATAVNQTGATLQGSLTSLGTATSITIGFWYGASASLAGAANATVGTTTATGPFSRVAIGLTANTTYYFRAWANGQGFTTGSILSFTTTAPPQSPPTVQSSPATTINETAATLQGSLTSLGTVTSVTVGFLYGTSPTLSGATNVTVGAVGATGTFSKAVSGLAANTTYSFRAWAAGQGFAAGAILTFTTTAPPPPGTVVLTFSYGIVGGGPGYTAPTLTYVRGGVTKTATLTGSAASYTADVGTTWSVTNPLAGSTASERWQTNQAASGTASTSLTTSFSYYHGFAVTFAYQVVDGGSGYSAPTASYVAFGTSSSTATGLTVWSDAASTYAFPGSLPGSSGTEAWRTNAPTGTVVTSGTVTASFYHQYSVTFTYGVVGGGSGYTAPTVSTTRFGSTVSLATGAAAWVDSGVSYSLTNPLGGSTASERWIASSSSGSVAASSAIGVTYYHQAFLTFAYSVLGGGSGYSAPTITYASYGATTSTPPGSAVWADSGSIYQFPNPLAGSSGTEAWRASTASGTVGASQTITATYYHQFLITFSLVIVNGNPPSALPSLSVSTLGTAASLGTGGTGWIDANTSYSYPAVVAGATGERWQAASSGGTATAPGTISASYYHQYGLTLSYQVTGGGSGYTAPSVQCVQAGQPLIVAAGTAAWADAGSWYQYALLLPGTTASERWVTSIPGGTVSGAGTVTVSYTHQFLVDFNYTVTGGGSGYSAPNVTYSNQSVASMTLALSTWVWGDAGAAYQYQNPLPGSTSTSGWRTNNGSGKVASSSTYSATYKHQYKLKFKTTSLSGTPTPVTPLINATVFGTLVGIPSGSEAWVDAGGTYDFPGVFYGPLAGERWITDTPASGTVLGPLNLTASYVHQYYLSLQLNSPDGGSISQTSGWYNEATPLTLQATASPGWQFQGWIGSGNRSYTGGETTASIAMDGPITETAVFYVGVTLVSSSGGSLAYVYGGTSGSVPAGGTEVLYLAPGTQLTVRAAPTLFYQFDGWGGGGSPGSSSMTVVVNQPQTLSAAFGISLYSQLDSVLGVALAVTALLLVVVSRRHRRKKKERALRAAALRARARAHAQTYR